MTAGPLARCAVATLEGLGTALWGFPPRLMAPIVADLGPLRALGWFVGNMPRYESTLRVFGALRTHLLCTAVSLVNGCRYCTTGHSYALQLIHLRDRGTLFPLDEHAIMALCGRSRTEIRRGLIQALEQARLHAEVLPLARTLLLMDDDQQPMSRDEVRMAHLVRMFGTLNSIGVATRTEPEGDQCHSPVNKDRALKLEYAILRTAPSM